MSTLSTAAIVERLCTVLGTAKIETDPFEYTIIHNVFPVDVYDAIQANLPPSESYISMSQKRTANPSAQQSRTRLNLTSPEFLRLPETQRECWATVRDAICDPKFVNLVFERFASGLSSRYGTARIEARVRVELFRDFAGYQILPHTDAPHKIFTFIFYLPGESVNMDLGTAVYVPKDRSITDENSNQLPLEMFDETKRAPFIPNTLFGFMKSERSFHGRPLIEADVERNMINCTFQHSQHYVG